MGEQLRSQSVVPRLELGKEPVCDPLQLVGLDQALERLGTGKALALRTETIARQFEVSLNAHSADYLFELPNAYMCKCTHRLNVRL